LRCFLDNKPAGSICGFLSLRLRVAMVERGALHLERHHRPPYRWKDSAPRSRHPLGSFSVKALGRHDRGKNASDPRWCILLSSTRGAIATWGCWAACCRVAIYPLCKSRFYWGGPSLWASAFLTGGPCWLRGKKRKKKKKKTAPLRSLGAPAVVLICR